MKRYLFFLALVFLLLTLSCGGGSSGGSSSAKTVQYSTNGATLTSNADSDVRSNQTATLTWNCSYYNGTLYTKVVLSFYYYPPTILPDGSTSKTTGWYLETKTTTASGGCS